MKMKVNLRKLGIFVALSTVLLLGLFLIAFSYVDIGFTDLVVGKEKPVKITDISAVPESVAEDATTMGLELYGDYHDKYTEFADQLLTAYIEAKDKDFVVIFNSGGWGTDILESSPGWNEICHGIEAELDNLGYSSLILDYHRTAESTRGLIKEFVEVVSVYPSKARNLASRVEFLTRNIPDIRIIVAGESNGVIISDAVMDMLHDNPRVYSIQTGTPFWHKRATLERTLALESNGMVVDSFSRGDIPAMLLASGKALVGISSAEEDPGRIFYFMRAPGHDYRWQYPDVYLRITDFLEQNFSFDKRLSSN
ncbi:MAG: hypothetical protein KKD83_08835 [Chloroflexi bacterium]|nr:hypothetical protein [Chloroflexota bacterium]